MVATVPLACGEQRQEERSLCTVFEQYLESRTTIAALDPAQTNAAQAADVVQQHQKVVARLETVTDGRFSSAVADLTTALNDLEATLRSVPDDADYATWAPLVKDDLDAVRDAQAHVESVIEPGCTPATESSNSTETSN